MSDGPEHDPYENEAFHLKRPALAATLLTFVVLGVFLYAVAGQASHAPKPGAHGAAAGSAMPAASAAPAAH